MKLLARYSRINLLVSISIFLISGIAYYILLNFILLEQIDDDLRIEEAEIRSYITRYDRLPESISVNDQIINYTPLTEAFQKRFFSTRQIPDTDKKEPEKFRQLSFGVIAAGKSYKVTVSKSLEDTESLIHSIFLITFLTIISMLAAAFAINRIVLKRLWKPFYETLDRVRGFKLGKTQTFQLPAEPVEEFGFMNQSIQQLIQQAQRDYTALKIFSENASHEIQTPLAVIRSKLDMLIQDDSITNSQSRLVQSVYVAVEKLTKLNHSLLLLTKIENNQYGEKSCVDIRNKIEEKVQDFRELWQSQNIKLTTVLGNTSVNINQKLLEILLNNLFSNATRHNYPGGEINVELNYDRLKITNTSNSPKLDSEKIFQRFYRPVSVQDENNSLGLGLSIIREICHNSGFTMDYFFNAGAHIFIIRWR